MSKFARKLPAGSVTFAALLYFTSCFSSSETPFQAKQRDAYNFMNDANRLVEGNRLADAELQYARACEAFALIDDMRGLTTCRTNRGILALQRGKLRLAESLFAQGLELCDVYKYETLRGRILVHLTLLYLQRGEEARAREVVARALESIKEKEDRRRALAYRGYLRLERGRVKEARRDFYEALHTDSESLRSYILINLARLYRGEDKLDRALKFARKAADIDRELAQASHLAYDYSIISNIYAAQLDFKEAVRYRRRALSLNMALSNNANARKDAAALEKYYSTLRDEGGRREMRRLKARLRK